MREFAIAVPDERLAAIRARVGAFRWDAMPAVAGWGAGASHAVMRAVARHWTEGYDWRAEERALNAFPQFTAAIDGCDIHFYHVRSPEPSARPLLLLHGWPGSVFEFLPLLGPLSDPARFGGDPADAFHLVVPSLPGFGFSGRPSRPIGPADCADLFVRLMTEVLGYDGYLCQGGDWGSLIATLMGFRDPGHCRGIHLNMVSGTVGQQAASPEEAAWLESFVRNGAAEGAYGRLHSTKPQSLGFAMTDSPLGVAAWIIEKFAGWSDLPRDAAGEPDLLARYSLDQLITNVMIYLAQDSFVTSTWIYYGHRETAATLPWTKGERCPVPAAVAAFPDPVFPPPPRSMAERSYNLVRWTDMPRGGHFAAMEEPGLFADDLRAFSRQLG